MGIRSFIKRKVSDRLRDSSSEVPVSATDKGAIPQTRDADGFTAVLRSSELPEGQGRTIAVGKEAIAVFNLSGHYYAIDDACTHEDAPLGEGEVRSHHVVCPYHDWVFDIRTGACLSEPDRPVGCFSTKLHAGFVWIGPRTSSSSDARGGRHADGLKTSEDAS